MCIRDRCFAALLMAGLDGIKNKIHPGEAMDKNLYVLPPEEAKEIPQVAGSLEEALNALDADRDVYKRQIIRKWRIGVVVGVVISPWLTKPSLAKKSIASSRALQVTRLTPS